MKLLPTDTERLILANQYRILAHLEPNRADAYERAERMLLEGHTWALESLGAIELPHALITEDVVKFVFDVLDMYRALGTAAAHHGIDIDSPRAASARFEGFDGNNETEHLAVAKVLQENGDRWTESLGQGDMNSHRPCLEMYERMLAVWRRVRSKCVGTPAVISKEDLERIIAARVHPDCRKSCVGSAPKSQRCSSGHSCTT
jgi:uncharacterized protein YfbU (UPF0304 family)